MSQDFLTVAQTALQERLKGEWFETTVSLRIREIGNLRIAGDTAEISDERADCAIIADQGTFEKILAGALNPMKAAMFGKLKIAGDAKTALKFGALFG